MVVLNPHIVIIPDTRSDLFGKYVVDCLVCDLCCFVGYYFVLETMENWPQNLVYGLKSAERDGQNNVGWGRSTRETVVVVFARRFG